MSPSPMRTAGAWLPALAPVVFLATCGVGLHVVVDHSAYDESQLPRLLVLSALLLVAVPLELAVPAIARRLDTSILREPLAVAFALYLVACVVSLAGAENVTAGFTDVFRTFASLLVFGLACLILPLDRDWRSRVVQTLVIAAAASVAVGMGETWARLGPGLHSRRAMEVVTGRMSNVNLYAGLLAMLLPWSVGGTLLVTGGWRGFAAITAVATAVMLIVIQSRAAWLAIAVAGLVVAVVVLVARRPLAVSPGVRRGLAAAIVGSIVGIVGLAAVTGSDTPVGRFLQSTLVTRPHQAGGPSDGGRTMIWGVTTRMIADHPLTGVGAGNFTVRLHEYYGGDDLDFAALSSDNWIQPHDDFLWVAAEKGLPGLAAFVAIFVAAAAAIRTVITAGSVADARLAVTCLGALVAYLVFSCVDFPLDRVTHQVQLAIVLAVVALAKHGVRPASTAPVPLPGWLVGPPLAAALVLGISYSAAALDQEREVIAARRACRDGDWQAMLAAAERAATPWKTLDPLATPVAFLEGMARLQLGDLAGATACLEQAFAANPNRMYVVNNLAAVYAETGRFTEAIPLFALAAERYPDRIEPRHNLAACLLEAGQLAEAVDVIESVPEEMRPESLRAMLSHAREQLAVDALSPRLQ
ncbi:MAG: O-antigen ligase family protein [Pirellulales bacterium]